MPTQRREEKRVEEHVGEGEREGEREKERTHAGEKEERERFGSSFYVFFSSTWACPMQIGLSQECCLFFLRSSLQPSDLPLTFLCSVFPGFSLSCLLATAILDSFSLFELPNSSNCCFLTCIQISQEAGQVAWYSHLFKNFPRFIVIHTVKGFGIANKEEIDVFLELSYESYVIQQMLDQYEKAKR